MGFSQLIYTHATIMSKGCICHPDTTKSCQIKLSLLNPYLTLPTVTGPSKQLRSSCVQLICIVPFFPVSVNSALKFSGMAS